MFAFKKAVTFTLIWNNNIQNLYYLGVFLHLISQSFEKEPRAIVHGKTLWLRGAPWAVASSPRAGAGELQRGAHRERCQLQTLETLCVAGRGDWLPLTRVTGNLCCHQSSSWAGFSNPQGATPSGHFYCRICVFSIKMFLLMHITQIFALPPSCKTVSGWHNFSLILWVRPLVCPETKKCLLITWDVQFTLSGVGQNHKSSFKNPSIRSKFCSHKPKSISLI